MSKPEVVLPAVVSVPERHARLTPEQTLRYQLVLSEERRASAERRAFMLEIQIEYDLHSDDQILTDGRILRAGRGGS